MEAPGLPPNCVELIAQRASPCTGGTSVMALMAMAGVSRDWRDVVAHMDLRSQELRFDSFEESSASQPQHQNRPGHPLAAAETAFKQASPAAKAACFEAAARLLRNYSYVSLSAATDTVLTQVQLPRAPYAVCDVSANHYASVAVPTEWRRALPCPECGFNMLSDTSIP